MKSTEVEVFVGGGGVGKTTLVTLRAINESHQKKKVLAITFDPSLRLGDLLNNDLKTNLDLDVFLVNPKQMFSQILSDLNYEGSESFKNNKLFKNLLESITGLQEFTSLYHLNHTMKLGLYDLILVDTPPFQNALDFFEAPQKLRRFFESTAIKLLIATEAKGLVSGLFKASSRVALKVLKNLTGLDFFNQLQEFLYALEKMRPVILKTLEESEKNFKSGKIKLNYISLFTAMHAEQAKSFLYELNSRELRVSKYYLSKYPGELNNIIENLGPSANRFQEFLIARSQNAQNAKLHLRELKQKYKIETVFVPYFEPESLNEVGRNLNDITKNVEI